MLEAIFSIKWFLKNFKKVENHRFFDLFLHRICKGKSPKWIVLKDKYYLHSRGFSSFQDHLIDHPTLGNFRMSHYPKNCQMDLLKNDQIERLKLLKFLVIFLCVLHRIPAGAQIQLLQESCVKHTERWPKISKVSIFRSDRF